MKKIRIEVCVGTSCHLMGSQLILQVLEDLSLQFQNRIKLDYSSCLNRCKQGPVVKIDDLIVDNATPEQVKNILEEKISLK